MESLLKGIPTNFNVWRRIGVRSPLCDICKEEEETIEHLLFGCIWIRGIWYKICRGLHLEMDDISSFEDWFAGIAVQLEAEIMLVRILFTCWFIWKIRCERVFAGKDIYIQSVISRIFEICEGLAQSKGESKAKECNEGNIDLWRNPDYGWIKINVDGASDLHSHNAGIGVIVRVAGAEYAVNHKYDRVILEIDSLV